MEATCRSTRRAILLGAALTAAALVPQPQSAVAATSLPEPAAKALGKVLKAPAEFLKSRQRADGGIKLLAPIRSSRMRLQEAEAALRKQNIYEPDPEIYKEMLSTIRSASLNCYTFEALDNDSIETRASILQRQLKIGDACTFRLIHKNVTNLLTASQDALKQETTTELDNVIRSFQLLDDVVDRARGGDSEAAERIPDVMQFAIAHTSSFEGCIERCLGLPPSNVAARAV
ncbi:hypothetical protein WJX72_009982 [[Myrmecia] bisecta]|uniref:Uncharacterized protein n=1 Tax=[Myrmecia] bisecta TaxID=41462 RepID=A0AAW1QG59_9CHLO